MSPVTTRDKMAVARQYGWFWGEGEEAAERERRLDGDCTA